jgi:hypothetical protein
MILPITDDEQGTGPMILPENDEEEGQGPMICL